MMATPRIPGVADLPALSALCLRSKAVWGYDTAFMDACVAELTLTRADLATTDVAMIDGDNGPVAVAQVAVEKDTADLLKLFVDPGAMGSGYGRRLFLWTVERARARGATAMSIEADPGAAPFYERMGAVRDGLAPSGSIPGRFLPRLSLEI